MNVKLLVHHVTSRHQKVILGTDFPIYGIFRRMSLNDAFRIVWPTRLMNGRNVKDGQECIRNESIVAYFGTFVKEMR